MTLDPGENLSRRAFVQWSTAIVAAAVTAGTSASADDPKAPAAPAPHPFLTPADDFVDVSRGKPKPHSLTGQALLDARLTPETWRLEITADPFVQDPFVKVPATLEKPRTLEGNTALDLPALMELGKQGEVKYLKAMQCLNIDSPLGQGLWEGVSLRTLLRACGKMSNVRRIYYWGFHNNDPKQIFQSSVNYMDAMETPPGEPPVFLAYRLNGAPIPLKRGGPVRMIVPWAFGFKSIKWLQHIYLTNDYRINDTYALDNNDPDTYLKTAAYAEAPAGKIEAGKPVVLIGRAICGRSGLKRGEYWVRAVGDNNAPIPDDDPELLKGPWLPCEIQAEPEWKDVLPKGVSPREVQGFDKTTGKPAAWPQRYSMVSFSATIPDLKPGVYEVRARAVDLNDFAQPEPCPAQKTGHNAIKVRKFEIVGK